MINISVVKGGSENTTTLIRRFSKRVQGSGIVRKVKSIRFHDRPLSKTKKRVSALRRLTRAQKRAEMERLGLSQPKVRGRRR